MRIKLEEQIEQKIEGIVSNLGFEIEYVEDVNESNQNIIRIVIDKPESIISVDDCEVVSRAVEDTLDKMIEKEYLLEVSSPGLERQLKNIKLYKKYIGSEIFVRLFKKLEQGKELTGMLINVDEQNNTITIQIDNDEICIEIKGIASAHTTYDFDAVLKSNKSVNINELKRF